MKKAIFISAFLFTLGKTISQNVGVNNTDPKVALDINGGVRLRSENTSVTGTSVVLNSNRVHHILGGTPTGNFSISLIDGTQEGQQLIITNTTNYDGLLQLLTIPARTTTECFYSNGSWKLIGTNEAISKSAWSLNGNAATSVTTNFIGTTDNAPLAFRVDNQKSGFISIGNTSLGYLSLADVTTGQTNTAIGSYALQGNLTGYFNTTIGYQSLQRNKASYNTATGYQALQYNTDGYSNTATGVFASRNNLHGINNVSIGVYALHADTSGSENVAVGSQALRYNQNRTGNTAVGANALLNNCRASTLLETQGINNTAFGNGALQSNIAGSGSVAIGYQAAYSDTAASEIIAIGKAALYKNYGNPGNLAIGDSALYNNSSQGLGVHPTWSINNLAIGNKAMYRNATGSSNTVIGLSAMTTNYNGDNNTVIGFESFKTASASSNNIAIGSRAMSEATGISSNIAIGTNALSKTLRSFNIAIGDSSLASYIGFVFDGGIGGNVAVGYHALKSQALGNHNTGIGTFAGENNTNGVENVFIGYQSGFNNTTGGGNVYIGSQAGYNARGGNKLYIENTTADSLNSLIYGDFLADSLLLNAKTVVRDKLAVKGNGGTTGLELGYGANKEVNAGRIGYGLFTANTLELIGGGTSYGTRTIKFWAENGSVFTGKITPDADNAYSLGSSGSRWKELWAANGVIQTSDATLKTNIQNSKYGLAEIMQMNPVQYNWKSNPVGDKQIGFLAQDMYKIIPEAVVLPGNGTAMGMKYDELIPVLTKAIQELKKELDELKAQVNKKLR